MPRKPGTPRQRTDQGHHRAVNIVVARRGDTIELRFVSANAKQVRSREDRADLSLENARALVKAITTELGGDTR